MISPGPLCAGSELVTRSRAISTEIAARHAAEVDAAARFPVEAVHAMKEARLLSAAVPKEYGGAGADLVELAACCVELAQGCAAAGIGVGIGGYKNDSKHSISRNYRDSLSAALMISNDRIFGKNASILLVHKDE